MDTLKQAIKNAERLLPGIPAPEGEADPRWKAIIEIGEYIQVEPMEVWLFIRKWGMSPNEDIRAAVATCLLEHLLEYHFKEFFPAVKKPVGKASGLHPLFACTHNSAKQSYQKIQRLSRD